MGSLRESGGHWDANLAWRRTGEAQHELMDQYKGAVPGRTQGDTVLEFPRFEFSK